MRRNDGVQNQKENGFIIDTPGKESIILETYYQKNRFFSQNDHFVIKKHPKTKKKYIMRREKCLIE
jgi:hypothetical protein